MSPFPSLPLDDPAWDTDPLEDTCPPDMESECDHMATEHRRIVALKKEELKQKIKHAKMAERIRDNIRVCLPSIDDCNSSCNNDSQVCCYCDHCLVFGVVVVIAY